MFIFDFVAETILDQILDWIYGKIIGFLNDFFVMMNNMGVELFELPWVNAVTTFFSYLGWALFGVGLVVGAFECAIEYQGGRGSIKDTAMNYIKGFMAVSLFTVVPVNLYSLCVSLQGTFGSAITGITNAESIGLTAQQVLIVRFRTHVIQHRGASYCRTVRIGYQHQDQHHEQCVCSPDRHQYDQNGREGSGSIRWCYDRVEIRKSV